MNKRNAQRQNGTQDDVRDTRQKDTSNDKLFEADISDDEETVRSHPVNNQSKLLKMADLSKLRTRVIRQDDRLYDTLFEALIGDDEETIQNHLGNSLKNFLTISNLSKLYKECLRNEEVSALFQKTRSPKCDCKKRCCSGPDYVDLPSFLDEVVVSLVKDQRFCFHAGIPRKSQDASAWCRACLKPRNFEACGTGADEKIQHTNRELFLWAILLNKPKLARLFWREGQDHLGGALYASALSKKMSSRAHNYDMTELCEQLKEQARDWELLAVSVLTICFKLNADDARELLDRKLNHWGPPDNPLLQPTLLNMARSFEMERFTAHTACQTKLRARWLGHMAPDTSRWKIFVCIFLPLLLPIISFRETHDDKRSTIKNSARGSSTGLTISVVQGRASPAERRKVSVWACCCSTDKHNFCSDLYHFYSSPVTKFASYALSYVVFLALISYYSMVQLDEGLDSFTAVEGVVHIWMFSMIVEDIRQIWVSKQRTVGFRLKHWFRDQWKFDLVMYVAYLVFVGLRLLATGEDFKFARSFLGITVVLAFLSSMQFFFILTNMGPKVIMIQNMLKDLVQYLVIFAIFMTGFGVVYQSLWFPNSPPEWRMMFDVGYFPYYQLYGELFLERFKGWFSSTLSDQIDGCEANMTLWRLQGSNIANRCPESNALLPWMLFVYLMLTNLLLANLLIAQFSYTFQKIQENSMNVWRYYRLCTIQDYVNRPTLAPPLILINHVYRIVDHLICRNKICDKNSNAPKHTAPRKEYQGLTQLEKEGAESLPRRSSADSGFIWDTRAKTFEEDIKELKGSTQKIHQLLALKNTGSHKDSVAARTQAMEDDVRMIKEKLLQVHSHVLANHKDSKRSLKSFRRSSTDTSSDA